MKKLGLIVMTAGLVAVLAVMTVGASNTPVESTNPNYNYIQEQPTTSDHDSPVIHQTVDQIGSVIFG